MSLLSIFIDLKFTLLFSLFKITPILFENCSKLQEKFIILSYLNLSFNIFGSIKYLIFISLFSYDPFSGSPYSMLLCLLSFPKINCGFIKLCFSYPKLSISIFFLQNFMYLEFFNMSMVKSMDNCIFLFAFNFVNSLHCLNALLGKFP